jgi:hypothetical protein
VAGHEDRYRVRAEYAPEEIAEIARKLREAAGLGDEPTELAAVFTGPHPETGDELQVVDEAPEGFPPFDLPAQEGVFAPD